MLSPATRSIEVHRLGGTIGAEISGVDLSRDLDDETIAEIRRIWLDHLVIFFRNQDLPPARLLALARRFGQPIEYPFLKGIDGFPEITPVVKLEHERVNFGGLWHTDTAYLETPPMGTMLIAREVPPQGGDTLFANMYLAYETLSPGLQRLLDGLVAVNSSAKADVSQTREDRLRDGAREDAQSVYEGRHPVVRTHPETGRKCLYLGDHAQSIVGMPYEEGRALIEQLNHLAVHPGLTYEHRWTPGQLLVWDNRCVMHRATAFEVATQPRVVRRCTVLGEVPT